MKYGKIITVAIGAMAIAMLFVVPLTTSAALTTPAIGSIAGGDGYINLTEKTALAVSGTVTATSSVSYVTINLYDGTHSATSTLSLLANATTYSTTTLSAAAMSDGIVSVRVLVADGIATSSVASNTVILDSVAPTISSVTWSDQDGNTNINAGDKIIIAFSEGMATSTATSTSLGLSAHTFGNSTLAWNTSTTTVTFTLGSTATIVSGDTINPTNATDFAGNAYSTASQAITDSTGPLTPTASLAAGTYTSTQTTTLTSTGSSNIYFTVDGSTPTCSSILYDGNFVIINHSLTLQAVGCDAYSNVTATPLSVDYIIGGTGGSTNGGGGNWGNPNAVTPAVPAVPGVSPATPAVPAHKALTMALSRDLAVGSEGNDVSALQTFLEQSGYLVMPNGVAKGYFGQLTKKAVMWFQKDSGLPTPGRVGPATRGILNQGW
jgi:hypothetical protein